MTGTIPKDPAADAVTVLDLLTGGWVAQLRVADLSA